jgi:hypothetical protein
MLTRRKLLDLAARGLVMAGPTGAMLTGMAGASSLAADQAEPAKSKEATAAPWENTPRRPPRFNDSRDWFMEKRFGLFAHWGIFSVAGWDSEEMYLKGMTRAEYRPYMHKFNPVKFDPDAWLDLAEQA